MQAVASGPTLVKLCPHLEEVIEQIWEEGRRAWGRRGAEAGVGSCGELPGGAVHHQNHFLEKLTHYSQVLRDRVSTVRAGLDSLVASRIGCKSHGPHYAGVFPQF